MSILNRASLILLFISVGIFFSACAKKYTIDKLPSEQLRFGTGGGFTGKEMEYLLLKNGQVFVKQPTEMAYSSLGKIKPKVAKTLFNQVKAMDKLQLQKPGNTYAFVNYQHDTVTHRMVFNDKLMKKDSVTNLISTLHVQLMQAMPKMK